MMAACFLGHARQSLAGVPAKAKPAAPAPWKPELLLPKTKTSFSARVVMVLMDLILLNVSWSPSHGIHYRANGVAQSLANSKTQGEQGCTHEH
jgi:hypothetical protein